MAKGSDIYGSIPTDCAEKLYKTWPGSDGHTLDVHGEKDGRVPPMDNEKDVEGN